MTEGELQEVASMAAKAAVYETLKSLGIDASNPLPCQQDFAHLRKQRIASEEVGKYTRLTLWGALISGAIAIFIVGVQHINLIAGKV
jgi:hypothetical protein